MDLLSKGFYKQTFGLIDPTSANYSPLEIALMHPKENITEYSALYNRIERFILLKIYDSTGLSLSDFLSLPREYVELIFRITAHKARNDYNTQESVAKDLKQSMGIS